MRQYISGISLSDINSNIGHYSRLALSFKVGEGRIGKLVRYYFVVNY